MDLLKFCGANWEEAKVTRSIVGERRGTFRIFQYLDTLTSKQTGDSPD